MQNKAQIKDCQIKAAQQLSLEIWKSLICTIPFRDHIEDLTPKRLIKYNFNKHNIFSKDICFDSRLTVVYA